MKFAWLVCNKQEFDRFCKTYDMGHYKVDFSFYKEYSKAHKRGFKGAVFYVESNTVWGWDTVQDAVNYKRFLCFDVYYDLVK